VEKTGLKPTVDRVATSSVAAPGRAKYTYVADRKAIKGPDKRAAFSVTAVVPLAFERRVRQKEMASRERDAPIIRPVNRSTPPTEAKES
jgi:hypothetical protein